MGVADGWEDIGQIKRCFCSCFIFGTFIWNYCNIILGYSAYYIVVRAWVFLQDNPADN